MFAHVLFCLDPPGLYLFCAHLITPYYFAVIHSSFNMLYSNLCCRRHSGSQPAGCAHLLKAPSPLAPTTTESTPLSLAYSLMTWQERRVAQGIQRHERWAMQDALAKVTDAGREQRDDPCCAMLCPAGLAASCRSFPKASLASQQDQEPHDQQESCQPPAITVGVLTLPMSWELPTQDTSVSVWTCAAFTCRVAKDSVETREAMLQVAETVAAEGRQSILL